MLHGHVRVAAQGGPDTEALVPMVHPTGDIIGIPDLDTLGLLAELVGPTVKLSYLVTITGFPFMISKSTGTG